MASPTYPHISPRSPWIVTAQPVVRPRMRLFCFPYAGGSATTFRAWPRGLPPDIEVCAVQLPGRAGRFRDPLVTAMSTLLDTLVSVLQPLFDEAPFAMYGHSMGSLVSFELCRRLRRIGNKLPVHLFVSGRNAPQIPDTRPDKHTMAEAEFVEELRRYGGTPEEVFREPELLALLLPAIRADFQVIETWEHMPEAPLDIPISAFGGTADTGTTREELDAWRTQTSRDFALHMLAGDHFFIQSAEPVLLGIVSRALAGGSSLYSHSGQT